MNRKFVRAVQKIERATGMQWDDFDWLDTGNSVFGAYDCDPDTSDGLMFTIAGNDTPAWSEQANGWSLDTTAKLAHQNNAITGDELQLILDFYTGGE